MNIVVANSGVNGDFYNKVASEAISLLASNATTNVLTSSHVNCKLQIKLHNLNQCFKVYDYIRVIEFEPVLSGASEAKVKLAF